jgi:PAS domain S-box-containing protein
MSAIGLTGWAAEELMFGQQSWLAWPAVFALFGNVAPLFALLAQPHRGPREPLAATTSVDIAGLAVVTGFLYSFFVTGIDPATASSSLVVVSEIQAAVVALALIAAVFAAGPGEWRHTYRRLAFGAVVSFVTLTISNAEVGQAGYRSAFVYDFTWILPFAFFPWAAASAPPSHASDDESEATVEDLTRPRPWVIFSAVALLPFIDFGLRQIAPASAPGVRDLSTAVAMISVLPLLVARIATERAELQQASGTTRLLGEVIDQAQDFILILTPDGAFRHANHAFCAATGFSLEELKNIPARDLLPDETMTVGELQSLFRAKGVWRGTITRIRKDGTTFAVAATMAPVLDERGRVAHVVSVERDVSEERRLREQLIHSERLSAVGQLVAGVAHELNNPLQSVIGVADLLLQAETREDVRRDLDQVRAGGYRAARIVKSLLLFARRSVAERAISNMNEMLQSTLDLRVYELKIANISVELDYANPAPLVLVNSDEIRQVVLNLILNAEHAIRSTDRPGTITLRTGVSAESAFLEIADDGPGVPAAVRGRVFEPFFTTKGVGQGTGLGLSISLGIAETHGGSLALTSGEQGACFRLTLPSLPASVQSEIRESESVRA